MYSWTFAALAAFAASAVFRDVRRPRCDQGRSPWVSRERSRTSDQIAGTTNSVSSVLLTMPPIIGAAMRFITLAPVPLLHRIGSRPSMVDATVIIFGRTRSTAPSMVTANRSRCVSGTPVRRRSSKAELRYTSMMTAVSAATPASARKPMVTATDHS